MTGAERDRLFAHYQKLSRAPGDRAEGAFESLGLEGAFDGSDAIRDRTEASREALLKIVEKYLHNAPTLREIVDKIVQEGSESLRQLAGGDIDAIGNRSLGFDGLEAIIRTDGSRPSFFIRHGDVDRDSSPIGAWGATLDGSAEALRRAVASVGRIDVPGSSSGFQGTGFLVHENLIVTNRHVLQVSARQAQNGTWQFIDGAAIDFGHEYDARASVNRRRLKRVVYCGSQSIDFSRIDHGKLDLALIELEPPTSRDEPQQPLALIPAGDLSQPQSVLYTIGYPGSPPRSLYAPTLLEQLFQSTYGHKRLAPGEIIPAKVAVSPWTLAHDATTLGGNSGSVVLLRGAEGVAAGLHYGGRAVDPRENWGHVLSQVLDAVDQHTGMTLRECLGEFDVDIGDAGEPPSPSGSPPATIPPSPPRGAPGTTPGLAPGASLDESIPFIRGGQSAAAESPARLDDHLAFDPAISLWPARLADLRRRGLIAASTGAAAETSGIDAAASLEAIIGASNLLPAWFLDEGMARSRATCLIQATGTNFRGQQGSWRGTGALVGANVLLTNHHVINSLAVAENAICTFDFQATPTGQIRQTKSYRLDPSRLFITSPLDNGLDYTFVWIEDAASRDYGRIRLQRRSLSIGVDEFANVISHPSGEPKAVTIQDNQVKWQDELVVHYTSDTLPGSSGAAVFNNQWEMVALHHASQPTSAVPGFSVLNEGIKISAIAAELEQRMQAGDNADAARQALQLFGGVDEMFGFFGSLGRTAAPASGLEQVVDSYRGEFDDVDVAFWNVEWFSRRYAEKLDAVAEIVFRMNLDVWALVESSPDAAEALVKKLNSDYGLDFDHIPAEPDASPNKQSCTVLWNKKTVKCRQEEWGEPIETWIGTHSRDFDDLALEAVEGKIFDRRPALIHVQSRRRRGQAPFAFYLVPVHLKAMAEGSKRRKMASEILAAAVRKKIELGADADWIIGGDFNAELATEDFEQLAAGHFTPITAADEGQGAFSYLKRPHLSLIDHIFVSDNLAQRFGSRDLFIVAAEREIPDYVTRISDHRPVLFRMALRPDDGLSQGRAESTVQTTATVDALEELKEMLGSARTAPVSVATTSVTGGAADVPEISGFESMKSILGPSGESASSRRRHVGRKRDGYLKFCTPEFLRVSSPVESTGGLEAVEVAAPVVELKHPVLLQVKDPNWSPPVGFEVQGQIGSIRSGLATDEALNQLEADAGVLSIEASRPGGVVECTHSVPFVRATQVQAPPVGEEGDSCLIALIDTGIDIQHEAFVDKLGNSRILEIWDQTHSGTPPSSHYAGLLMNYGHVYTAADIAAIRGGAPMPPALRDPQGHGTHVASIAAGQRGAGEGTFAGGVAPAAKIVVVIAKLEANPGDPLSIGYSRSHFEALEYIDAVATKHNLPVVINVSLGMNAGAHDGTSLLEVGFDSFTQSGTKEGRIIVKSAGNERGRDGHAQFTVANNGQVVLTWDSQAIRRNEDVIELWFSPQDELTFTLKAPDGGVTPTCSVATPEVQAAFPSGNVYSLVYDLFHRYAGDSLCRIVIRPGTAPAIQTGLWQLTIVGTRVRSRGTIQAWLERINTRPTRFVNHQNDDMTLSIPGTVKSVITVGAVNAALPLMSEPNSSFGPTRTNGEKPDLVAPGTLIVAAQASTPAGAIPQSGTSMAAPHVTGAIALVLSRQKKLNRPLLSAAQARQALITRTQNYTGFHSPAFGYGVLDAEAFYRTFIPT